MFIATKARPSVRALTLVGLLLLGCASASAPLPSRPVPGHPLERQQSMVHLRRQIVSQTAEVPDGRYAETVRPTLRAQLLQLGLAAAEADVILADVDATRGKRSAVPAQARTRLGPPGP